MATREELLQKAIEELTREMRDFRRSASSRSSSTSTSAPRPAPRPEAEETPSNLKGDDSGFEINFDADKIGKDFQELFQNLGQQFETFKQNMENTFGSIITEVQQLTVAMQDARVELFKQAGAFKELQQSYSQFAPYARSIGLSYKEAAAVVSTLAQKVSGFIDLTVEEQTVIEKQTGALERLGVSAVESAASIDALTKSFGQSIPQAARTTQELFNYAKALKVSPNIIMKDFSAAAPRLAQFGSKAIDVFKNSEIFVRKFGISLDSILGQIDKFDTFESAAEAAGQLNIALGKNFFDTQELLFTTGDPSKRIEMISQKLKDIKRQTGQSFDDMNVFLRKDLAKTLGLQADEIRRLQNLSETELRTAQERIKSGKSIGESIEQSAKKTLTLDERLTAMKERILSAFMPLLEKMMPIIQEA